MSWKDDLGELRLLGPDIRPFQRAVTRVWDHIEDLESALHLLRAELDLPDHLAEVVGDALAHKERR